MGHVDPNATYNEIENSDDWKNYKSPEYWDYRKKWDEYPQKQIVADFPIHLDIETTNACNLKCPMCARTILIRKKIFHKIQFMEFKFYQYLIDQGVDHGLCSIKLNFMGEPLLHPDIVRMVKYAKDKGILHVMV